MVVLTTSSGVLSLHMSLDSALLVKPKKAKGSAPGQYLGYALQEVRLFFHLLDCEPEAFVGTEYIDDVSTQNADGSCVAEQCKSALKSNPISDAAVDLWKTFANWADNVQGGQIDPTKTIFRLYVVPSKTGKLATRLSEAKSDDEIASLLSELEIKIKSSASKPRLCDPHLKSFLALGHEKCALVIKHFVLEALDADPLKPIRTRLDATIRPDLAEDAIRWGIGLAKTEIDRLIRSGEPPLLNAATFRKKFRAYIAAHDNARFLYSLTDEPSNEMVADLLEQAPVFVRQLDLVGASIDIKARAAGDFLWSSSDKTRWADEGHIFEESLVPYNDSLKRRHSLISSELAITAKGESDSDRGKLVYLECCKMPSEKLQELSVPPHFLSGSLNSLANNSEIGWHPKYRELLGEEN